jgi:hypothetical protein
MLVKFNGLGVRTVNCNHYLYDLGLVEWVIEAHSQVLSSEPICPLGCNLHDNGTPIVLIVEYASYQLPILLQANGCGTSLVLSANPIADPRPYPLTIEN